LRVVAAGRLASYGSVRRRRCCLRFSLVRPLLARGAVPGTARLWLRSGWRSQRTGREMGGVRGLCVMARGSLRWAGCSEWWRHLAGVAPSCTDGRFPNRRLCLFDADRRLRAAVSGLGSSVRRLADQPVLALPGRPHCPAGAGDGGAEDRCDTRVAADVYGKRLRAGGKWETAGKRPGARGNIEGRRRAYLTNAGLRPDGRRCACCGSGNVAVVRRTARSSSAAMPGRGLDGWAGGQRLPSGDSRVLRMSCSESRGAGEPVRARGKLRDAAARQ
jgi:hypothetical protein